MKTTNPGAGVHVASRRWAVLLAAGLPAPLQKDLHAAESILRSAVNTPCTQLLPSMVAGLECRGMMEQIPEQPRKDLLRRHFEVVGLHLRQKTWLAHFIQHVLPRDIPILLLKGWGFNGTLYPLGAPRASGDIDLLVREEDVARLCEGLGTIGKPVPADPHRMVSTERCYERAFRVAGDLRLRVDVHRHLADPVMLKIPQKALWQRSLRHPVYNDERVRMLSPEDAFLHLVANALIDQNVAPHALVDACRLIRIARPDVDIIAHRAKEWGIGALLAVFVRHLADVAELPYEMLPSPGSRLSCVRRWLSARYLGFDRRTAPSSNMALRVRQILALGLLDRPLRLALPFLCSYAWLRMLDVLAATRIRPIVVQPLQPERAT